MVNTQPPERLNRGDTTTLDVHSIFYTIQGEGTYSGWPAVFIRLAGCNLQCPGCDTEYTAARNPTQIGDLYTFVQAMFPKGVPVHRRLIVVTGGEPFRQNLTKLVHRLLDLALVQIETNGTLPPSTLFPHAAWVVCSPKAGKVHPGLLPHIRAYKYVGDAASLSPVDGLPTSVLGNGISPARPPEGWRGPVYLSPMDSGEPLVNAFNTSACAASCMEFGYVLNLQIHKIVGLP